jgi:hypothetical protein
LSQHVAGAPRTARSSDGSASPAAFGVRLRDEVDLSTLTGELLAAVHQTIQPTQASLWLRTARQGPD